LEGVSFLCETIHELSRKKLNGGIFKLDFKPMIKCPFLPQQIMETKGFSSLWFSWIHQFVSGVNVAVKVNNDVGPYSQLKKCL
jgi:hypothetical protein